MRAARALPLFLITVIFCITANAQMRKIYTDVNPDNQLLKLDFFNQVEGYAAFTDFIGFSADTGHTWTKRPITLSNVNYNGFPANLTFGFGINGVKAFDRNNLLVYGHYGFVPAILSSNNGGATYTLIEYSRYDPRSFNGGFTDMIFPENNNTGYVIDQNRVLKTTNRGVTWQTSHADQFGNLDHLQAVDNLTVFALGITPTANRLLKTIDGGINWINVTLPIVPDGYIIHADFLNRNIGWISMVGSENGQYIFKTTDGGTSWVQMTDPIASPFATAKMKFISESTGYALYGYFVFKTIDSGKTWEPLPRDNNFEKHYGRHLDLQFRAPSQLWAGGDHGFIELSMNGGGTPFPKAYFKTDTVGVTATGTVKLLNFSNPAHTAEWFVNGNKVSNGYNASYTHQDGILEDTIMLVVSNGTHNDTAIKIQGINPPLIIYSFSPTMAKNGTEVIITGSNFFNTKSVKFGGVDAAWFTVESLTRIRAIVGNGATGSVTVSTEQGTVGSKPGFVFFHPPAVDLPINVSDTILCKSEPVRVTISNTEPNVRYTLKDSNWKEYGSVESSGGTVQLFTNPISEPGRYTIWASRTNINYTLGFTTSINISVEKTRSVFVAENVNLVPGETTAFSTRSHEASNFQWQFNDGASITSSTQARPSGISYSSPGQKSLTLISISANGCRDTVSGIALTVVNPPSGAANCFGLSVPDSLLGYQPEQFMQLNKVLLAGNGEYYLSGRGNKPLLNSRYGRSVKIPYENAGFFADYSADGILKWYIHLPGSIDAADKDNTGNIYILGSCHELNYLYLPGGDSIRITSTNPNAPDYSDKINGFILKIDANGKYLWHSILSDPSPIFQGYPVRGGLPDHIKVQGNRIVVSGRSLANLDYVQKSNTTVVHRLQNSGYENDMQNAFILSITSEGSYLWHNYLTNGATNQMKGITGLAFDKDGNCLIGGYYEDHVEITDATNQKLRLSGRYASVQSYLFKLDATGKMMWHTVLRNEDDFKEVHLLDMATDKSGNSYVTGTCSNFNANSFLVVTNGDGSVDTVYRGGLYVMKFNPSGKLVWESGTSNSFYGGGEALYIRDNEVYVAGTLMGNNEPVTTTISSTDGHNITRTFKEWEFFIVKYDSSGVINRFTSSGESKYVSVQIRNLVIDNNNNFLVSAATWNSGDSVRYFSIPVPTYKREGIFLKLNPDYCIGAALPVADAGEDHTLCKGDSLQIGVAPTGSTTYSWSSRPAGFNSGMATPVVNPLVTTKYLVTAVSVDGLIKKDSVTITVRDLPLANAGSDAATCTGNTLTLGTPAVDGLQYSWTSQPAGFSSAFAQPDVTAGAITKYIVHATDLNGCVAFDTVVITGYNSIIPTVTITADSTQVCIGSPLSFAAAASGSKATDYQWKVNGVNTGDNSPQFSSATLANGDQVTVKITSHESCASPDTAVSNGIQVAVINKPSISINGNTLIEKGKIAQVRLATLDAGTLPRYQWQDSTSTHSWGNINGANGETLYYTPVASNDKVRCLLTSNAPCAVNPVQSNTLVFTVNTATSIDPVPALNMGIHYYPNPITHSLTIDSLRLSDQWETIEVIGVNGNRMYYSNAVRGRSKAVIDLKHLPAGLYIAVLGRKTGTPVFIRLIKQ